jgi:hypothetical protein
LAAGAADDLIQFTVVKEHTKARRASLKLQAVTLEEHEGNSPAIRALHSSSGEFLR